jgi:hypothetical protein
MEFDIVEDGTWYHGSDKIFDTLEIGSTITQWKELAEAFSHKPPKLCYSDNGDILHNGQEFGYLYIINEEIIINKDIYQHPRTTMDRNVEFLTNRPLSVRLVKKLGSLSDSEISRANEEFAKILSQ